MRSYLPDFATSDPSVATRVTARQLLNHSAGWLGDYLLDTGGGDDALARYVAGMADLPQLTRPGREFAYNDAALSLAGRLIEVTTAARMSRPYTNCWLTDGLAPQPVLRRRDRWVHCGRAAQRGRRAAGGGAILLHLPRSVHPAGGLISSVPAGPGGTLYVELDGMGVTWMLRPSAEGVRILQHGGDWPGQHSAFVMVPERDLAVTMLTNSVTGPALMGELFSHDWALRRLAGIWSAPR